VIFSSSARRSPAAGRAFFERTNMYNLSEMLFWKKWPIWLRLLLLSLVGVFFVSLFLTTFSTRRVFGEAMAPNWNNGAFVIVTKFRQDKDPIRRSDVIIFKAPINKDVQFIKRVIGLPGETIMIKSGEVYINDQKIDESNYVYPGVQTPSGSFMTDGKAVTIPEGQYFTLGDNRPASSDSRGWGFVPQESILGKVVFCYWNCGK
jgi:signal peptidase I